MHSQTIDNQRTTLESRSGVNDKYFYLDSVIALSQKDSEQTISARILKAELLKSEGKNVNALEELMSVTSSNVTLEHPELAGLSYLQISEIYIQKGSYDEAKKYLVEAYTLFEHVKDREKKALVLIKSAHVAKKMEQYTEALSYLKNAHTIYEASGKNLVLEEIAREIGILAYEAKDFPVAKDYLIRALEGFEKLQDHSEQILIYETLSKIYDAEQNEEMKIEMLERVVDVAQANTSDELFIEKGNKLVLAYSKANRSEEALNKHIELIDLMQGSNSAELYTAEVKLCRLYELNGQENDAIKALHRANNLAIQLDSTELILSSTKYISDFYTERGDFEKANEQLVINNAILSESLAEAKANSAVNPNKKTSESDKPFISNFSELGMFWECIIIGGFLLILGTFVTSVFILRKRAKVKRILEWKVYKRTKEIRTLNSELNTYFYRSSHDLRNPLTSIRSLISLLRREEQNEISTRYLELMDNCTNQMDQILLNLSRAVDYKKLDVSIEQVNFNNLMTEIEQEYSKELEGLNLDWKIREKAPFFSDPSLIKVILNKTINNSIQYRLGSSADYCKVSIVTDSKGAHVSIEDNGQGISESVKGKVFEMFEKGTHKSKGAGLGLYLVKIVSEKIRAKITLESKENQGLKLDFRLPNLSA